MNSFIKLNLVTKVYSSVTALKGISIDFPRTGMIFIKGKSGCGKTTLLNILGGLDAPTSGNIKFNGTETSIFTQKDWDNYRNSLIGFVFQDFNLIEGLSVKQNLELICNIQNAQKSILEIEQKINEILSFVDMDGYQERQVTELSAGQKQRVAIARAIAKESQVILADEPTGNLDEENSRVILSLLKGISKERLVIIVTHDTASALEYGDRILTMSDGQIVECLTLNDSDNDDIKKDEELLIQKKTRTKALSIAQQLTLAWLNLSRKKIRLVFTTIMFCLALFLLHSVSFILTYDRATTISSYFSRHEINTVFLYQNKSYETLFFDEINMQISSGEKYVNDVLSKFPELKLIPRIKVNFLTLNSTEEYLRSTDEVMFMITDEYSSLNLSLLEGRFPINEDEIVITDYIAHSLLLEENILGKTINVENRVNATVVGIIKTDYKEKDIALKVKLDKLSEFEQFELLNVYQIAIATSTFDDLLCNATKCITLPQSNIAFSNLPTRYLQSFSTYASLELVTEDLLYGRLPQDSAEVLVSYNMASYLDINEDTIGQTYNFIDIYSENFNNAYSNALNIYDYFPNGITVVGVYDVNSLSIDYEPDVLISSNIYNNILESYLRYYQYADYAIPIKGDTTDFVKKADSEGYMFRDPAIEKIYIFQGILEELRSVIIIFFVVVVLLTIFILSMFISNNIKVNSKKIGVLKALGFQTNQVVDIFLIEGALITIIAYFLSAIMTALFLNFINNSFVIQVPGYEFDYLYWNVNASIVVAILACGMSVCSAVVPIISMTKKKPVEIIRNIIY